MNNFQEPGWKLTDLVPAKLYSSNGFARNLVELADQAKQVLGSRILGSRKEISDSYGKQANSEIPKKRVALLGGAGFLGSRVAAQLLDNNVSIVIVSRNPYAVIERWREFLSERKVDELANHPGLTLRSIDLACTRDTDWMDLIGPCSHIVHLAARVHAFASLSQLMSANVNSCIAACELAEYNKALLLLTSTLSVFVSSNGPAIAFENRLPNDPNWWVYGGYAQSKVLGECIAQHSAVPLQILRLGLLVPEARVPFPPDHSAQVFIRELMALGSQPSQAEQAWVDLTPVDSAARALVAILESGSLGVFHYAGLESLALSDLCAALNRYRISVGLPELDLIDSSEWDHALTSLTGFPRSLIHSAFHKSSFLKNQANKRPVLNADLFQASHRYFDSTRTQEVFSEICAKPECLVEGLIESALKPSLSICDSPDSEQYLTRSYHNEP